MSTRFTLTVLCDDGRSPDCLRRVERTTEHPRDFDHYGTELFQQGWLRGFRQTDPSPSAISDTLVSDDVCPACAELNPDLAE